MSCPRGCCASYREHLDSIRLGVTSPRMQQDRTAERDMHAYKRLRANGVQPKGIEGSAELERGASTTHEVEHRNIITCLLYTSDAADEEDSVDLGGRRESVEHTLQVLAGDTRLDVESPDDRQT